MPDCCPSEKEEFCICDFGSCPSSVITCEQNQRKYRTNPEECCPVFACECDTGKNSYRPTLLVFPECNNFVLAKCDKTIPVCADNEYLTSTDDGCCTAYSCQCKECAIPEVCKDGWTSTETTDNCGCVTRCCEAPKTCVYDSELHSIGM